MALPAALLSGGYEGVLRPLLFASHGGDPEAIHEQMIDILSWAGRRSWARAVLRLLAGGAAAPRTVAGLTVANPVGLAAGMDKEGRAARAWASLGFGFAELGTVTAQAQPGNPRPRVFRLPDSSALINRMGFNNDGAAALAQRLAEAGIRRGNQAAGIPLGVSLGKTKVVDLDQAVEDYLASFDAVHRVADYVAVNVSSPNTPGLRGLQDAKALMGITGALTGRAAEVAAGGRPLPVWVKLAPDLEWSQIDDILAICQATDVAGVIATNTTLARTGLAGFDRDRAGEAGGLSGAPLRARALEVVGYIASHCQLPVIGVGGLMNPEDADAMFEAGASLVQLYTGFIYRGPALAVGIAAGETRRNVR